MIETKRLIIRPFVIDDSEMVYECCNDFEVVKTTLGLPWPYTKEIAEKWISKKDGEIKSGSSYELGICFKENPKKIIGCVALMGTNSLAKKAELGYWIKREFWNQGIATEAAKAIIDYGFNVLNLNSIYARYFDINPASGKVMEKCGMKFVGTFRQHEYRFEKFYNIKCYEILKTDNNK